MSNMYENAKTWNPFKGCLFNCSYCKPSFQAQAKRQKHNCMDCYNYKPHVHYDRLELSKIPKADIVFACGNGDVTFCDSNIMKAMMTIAYCKPHQTFYFQSKNPVCFSGLAIPDNVILVTTLETDIDEGYRESVSATAPLPSERYRQFKELNHKRKVITIEPIMEFSDDFKWHILAIKPEYVWIGYNSKPNQVKLWEPPLSKTLDLITFLESRGIKVKRKLIREATKEATNV